MSDANAAGPITEDAFLGGRLTLLQPALGYRAGLDAVLLAAAIPANEGALVLELGCGVGVAALCLTWRTGAVVTGLELQPGYAALARQNALANGLPLEVIEGDVAAIPATLKSRRFDHVIANPPFFAEQAHSAPADQGRATAHIAPGDLLDEWCQAGARRLAPDGSLTMIHRVEALTDLIVAFDRARLGGLVIQPISPRPGKDASRLLISARKGARAAPVLRPPITLHLGQAHAADGGAFAPQIEAVLRGGAPLFGEI